MAQNHDYEEVSNRTQNITNTLFVSGNRVAVGTPSPATTLHVLGTDSLVVPVGTTAQRGTEVQGGIRYSTSLLTYEGYDGSQWRPLGGVIDVDRDTYIIAEDFPTDDNDELDFFTHGTARMSIASAGNIGIGLSGNDITSRFHIRQAVGDSTIPVEINAPNCRINLKHAGKSSLKVGTIIFNVDGVGNQHLSLAAGQHGEVALGGSNGYATFGNFGRFNGTGLAIGHTSPEASLHIRGDGNTLGTAHNLTTSPPAVRLVTETGNNFGEITHYNNTLYLDSFAGSNYGHIALRGRNSSGNTPIRLYVKYDGNVGIGTDTNPGAKLHVQGTFKADNNGTFEQDLTVEQNLTVMGSLSVRGDLTYLDTEVSVTSAMEITNSGTGPALKVQQTGTEPIAHFIDTNGDDVIIADDGKLGLGIATPNEKLTVAGNISASGELMLTNGGGFLSTNLDHGDGPEMKIYGAVNKKASLYFGDTGDVVQGGITYDTSTNKLFLKSHDNHTAVTIDSNERVGIGTTAPINNLHVDHATGVWGGITIGETGEGAEQFHISHFGGPGSGTILTQEGDLPIRFNTNDTERMRVAGDGRVGIGTTNPDQLLHIEGDTNPGLRVETTEGSSSGSTIMYMNSSTQLVFAARNHDSTANATMQLDISPRAGDSATTAGGAQQLIRLFRSSQPMNTGMEFMKPGTQANAGAFRWIQSPEELRLGIGTGDPSRNLHIKGNPDGVNHGLIRVESVSADEWAGIEFYRETSGGEGKGGAWIGVQGSTSTTTGTLEIGAAHNAGIGASNTVRMRISDPVTEIMDALNIVNDGGTTPQVNLQSANGQHGWRLRGNVNNSTYGDFVIENVSSAVKDGATRSAGSDYLNIDQSGEVRLGHAHHIKFNEGGNGGDSSDGADIRLEGYGLIGSEGHMYITAGAGDAQGSIVFKSGAGKSESSTNSANAIKTSTGHNLLTLTPTDVSDIGSRGEAYFYTPLRVGGAIGAPLDTAEETTRLYTLSAGNGTDRTKRINGLDGAVMGNDTFIIEKGDSEHYNPDSGIAFVFHSRGHHTGAGSTAGFDLDVPLHLHPRGNSTGTNREDSSIQTGWPLELYGQHSGVGSNNYVEAWGGGNHDLTVPADAALIKFKSNYYNDPNTGEVFDILPTDRVVATGFGEPTHICLYDDVYGFGVEGGTLAVTTDRWTRFYGRQENDPASAKVEGMLIDHRGGMTYTAALHLSGTRIPLDSEDGNFRYAYTNACPEQFRTHTYMMLDGGRATTDWAAIRQIGTADNYHLSIDIHDNIGAANEPTSTGGFSIRTVNSSAGATATARAIFSTRPGIVEIGHAGTDTGANRLEGGEIFFQDGAAPDNAHGWHIDSICSQLAGSTQDDKLRFWHDGPNPVVTNLGSRGVSSTPASNSNGAMALDHDGNVWIGGTVDENNTSDINLKDDIKPIENAVDKVKGINGVEFKWKTDPGLGLIKPGKKSTGVIAQDVEKVLPTAVKSNSRDQLCVEYNQLIPLLVEAVKDQQTQIEDLKQQIADLQSSSDT